MTSTSQNGAAAPGQFGATIVKTIVAERLESLRTLLQKIGDDLDGNPHVPFARLTSVHFMSWFIVEGKGMGPHLFLELNVDGPIEPFLNDLVAQAKAGIDLIYSHCAGYPSGGSSSTGQLVRYLLTDDVGYDCYYIGWRGLSKSRILQERTLRAQLETFLDQAGDSTLAGMSPSAVRGMIQEYVAGDPALAWAKTFPPRPFLVRNRDQVLMALKGLGILILLGLIRAGYFGLVSPWALAGRHRGRDSRSDRGGVPGAFALA
jgi:hypothetical protein